MRGPRGPDSKGSQGRWAEDGGWAVGSSNSVLVPPLHWYPGLRPWSSPHSYPTASFLMGLYFKLLTQNKYFPLFPFPWYSNPYSGHRRGCYSEATPLQMRDESLPLFSSSLCLPCPIFLFFLSNDCLKGQRCILLFFFFSSCFSLTTYPVEVLALKYLCMQMKLFF